MQRKIEIPSSGTAGHHSESFKNIYFVLYFYKQSKTDIDALNIRIYSDKNNKKSEDDITRGIYSGSVTVKNAAEIKRDHIYNILIPAYEKLKQIVTNIIPITEIVFSTENEINKTNNLFFTENSSKFNLRIEPKRGYTNIETTGKANYSCFNEPEMEYNYRQITIYGAKNISKVLNILGQEGVLTTTAKRDIQSMSSNDDAIEDVDTKALLIAEIKNVFGDDGAYKNRWFVDRAIYRDDLINELLNYIEQPNIPIKSILGKLSSVGRRAQKNHVENTGTRFFCGLWLVNPTCGFKSLTDSLIQKYTINETDKRLICK